MSAEAVGEAIVRHDVELDPKPEARFVNIAAAVQQDKLSAQDAFKRTYLGHGRMSSAFVFQGHPGPFQTHVHVSHDEVGIVLAGSGKVWVAGKTHDVRPGDLWIIPANVPHGGEFGEPTQVLFVSAPQDHPLHQDRIWLDGDKK